MDLSVVIPTLNGRDRLAACLDGVAAHAPDAEVVVVNGPSTDGTTGMIRERDDVDVLVEVSTRTGNVARNAGLEVATGDVIAFLQYDLVVEPTWLAGLSDGLDDAPVVTGPTHRTLDGGMTTEESERRQIGSREVTYFNGGNVAFRRPVLDALDGFDEYLEAGGDRDAAHRLAGLDYEVAWRPEMCVRQEYSADGGTIADRGVEFRALTYRLVKNYGIRPAAATGTTRRALRDALVAAGDVLRGDLQPTEWLATGRAVVTGVARGAADGLVARLRDRSPVRNPHGISDRSDRAVARYDWR
ncbi:glycosyltransferase family 2 protein [Haloplanus aerogenes]|uniref:Glycosyl transferase family 2 n=1 Tax=Haloplanus aerogenes TaxID=660522 RepID=A0A3M0CZ01_9EURY|nr:glycosyltransferase family A protein [Haloplanus aerogenes]AZH24933.1 glycosyltransferase family 2 protein [Haloplanus aerogenes]RMB13855.1 glycosyl transferase family 2 [Haloplanus aerogenes]